MSYHDIKLAADLTAKDERIAALEAERDALAAALDDAEHILQFVAETGFWVCDDEWRTSEPDQDDDRHWRDYSEWASTLLNTSRADSLASVRREAALESLRGLPPRHERRFGSLEYIRGWDAYREFVDAAIAALEEGENR